MTTTRNETTDTLVDLLWRTVHNDERYLVRDLTMGAVTLSETRLHAGRSTRGHAHPWPEVYQCNEGVGTLFLDDEPYSLTPGARFVVPGGTHHRVATDHGVTFTCVFEGPRR